MWSTLFLGASLTVICVALWRWRNRTPVARERSVSIPSEFLLHGPYPPESEVPFNVIIGLIFLDELPTREQLIETAQARMADAFLRFRAVPKVCRDGVTMEMREISNFKVTADHVTLMDVADEKAILAIANEKLVQSLPRDKPLWRLIMLRNRSNPARSAVLAVYDHALGDGISAVAIFNSLFTDEKGASPNLPTSFVRKTEAGGGKKRSVVSKVFGVIPVALDAIRAFFKILILTSPVAAQDAMTVLSGPITRTEKKWSHRSVIWTSPLPLELIRPLRTKLNVTVNDVLTSVLAGALRKYMEHRNDPSLKRGNGRVRVLLPLAMPRPVDPEKPLRNFFAMLSSPLPVFEPDRRRRILQVHSNMNRLKSSPEAFFTMLVQTLGFQFMPLKNLQLMARDLFTSHSVLWSNIPGPTAPVFLCGKRVREILPGVATIQHQVTALSYNGGISVAFMVDDHFMSDAHLLASFFEDEYRATAKMAA